MALSVKLYRVVGKGKDRLNQKATRLGGYRLVDETPVNHFWMA